MPKHTPGFLQLLQTGMLQQKVKKLFTLSSPCKLCPWKCGVDRTKGQRGRCNAGNTIKIATAVPHFGEEPVISGRRGSGTIFFTHCNLKCCFCQNYQISQEALGTEVSVDELAAMMLDLQEKGCHNINLVSAVHYLPYIITALHIAAGNGLSLPIVYNTNGYEDVDVLWILNGIVDIYLPDIKYAQDSHAMKYSSAKNYSKISLKAIQEMFRQVGNLLIDNRKIALRGLLVRHLVLPDGLSGTDEILKTLKQLLGSHVFLSLMGQYTPCYKACKFKSLRAGISKEEYNQAIDALKSLGFENGWTQDIDHLDTAFLPDFSKADTWN